MKRLIACLLFVIVFASAASAQWDRIVPLSNDEFDYLYPQMIVDDSMRLHVFVVREDRSTSPQTGSLIYQRFDSWGNPLCEQTVISPDSHWIDYGAGILLDRNNNIHIVWSRFLHNVPPVTPRIFYTRMNLSGQILTPPIILTTPVEDYYVQQGINLTQSTDGNIWVACQQYFAVLSDSGTVVSPLQLIVESTDEIMQPVISAAPDGHVWAAVRRASNVIQNASLVRLDTTVRTMEVITESPPGQYMQIGPMALYIDRTGSFHYILGREDCGVFYEYDCRNGTLPDTSIVYPWILFGGSSFFSHVGTDTLLYMIESLVNIHGILHTEFSLSGQRGDTPALVANNDFSMGNDNISAWCRGSTWVLGGYQSHTTYRFQLAMIHIPGPNEPPNAVDDPTPAIPSSDFMLYPNPANGGLFVQGPMESVKAMSVFNVLGQQVMSLPVPSGSNGMLSLPQIDALSTGEYFLKFQTRNGETVRKFVIAR